MVSSLILAPVIDVFFISWSGWRWWGGATWSQIWFVELITFSSEIFYLRVVHILPSIVCVNPLMIPVKFVPQTTRIQSWRLFPTYFVITAKMICLLFNFCRLWHSCRSIIDYTALQTFIVAYIWISVCWNLSWLTDRKWLQWAIMSRLYFFFLRSQQKNKQMVSCTGFFFSLCMSIDWWWKRSHFSVPIYVHSLSIHRSWRQLIHFSFTFVFLSLSSKWWTSTGEEQMNGRTCRR